MAAEPAQRSIVVARLAGAAITLGPGNGRPAADCTSPQYLDERTWLPRQLCHGMRAWSVYCLSLLSGEDGVARGTPHRVW